MEEKLGLTFGDILLVPAFSQVLPAEVDLKAFFTKKIRINVPLVSAAMDTVTESKTAIALAQQGGIGVIHRNLSIERQKEEVEKVKNMEFWIINNPITAKPTDTLSNIFGLSKKTGLHSFPVVEEKKLVGIVTSRDLLFEENLEKKVSELMTKKLVTIDHEPTPEEAKRILHDNRIEKLPIVDKKGNLAGLVTIKDLKNRQRFPNALKDKRGRLMVAAAIGPKDFERAKALLEADVDALVIDTAHGHSKNVIEAVKKIKKDFSIEIVAGNISTKEAVADLIAAGADAVKVGQGPGAICTTRIISGVGVPQFSAILDCSGEAEKYSVPVIADGGIRYSGDITKALAAGAKSVMIGSLFAGCEETPGKTVLMYNRKFKQYRGMGSLAAMLEGQCMDRYNQESIRESSKLVPEGIEGIVSFKGTIEEVVHQLVGGLRAGMGYVGARNIEELRTKTKWIRISAMSLKESHPHDITITDEAPNYPGNSL